jgi:DNA repair photolyase
MERPSQQETHTTSIKIMSRDEIASVNGVLKRIIDYRKSGLSLNHIIGCSLNCAYCVRHFFDNFEMKVPRMIVSDEEAVRLLTGHKYFTPHRTPLQLFNRATDPFLPSVKPHTHNVLQLLDGQGLTNLMLIITRYKVTVEDMLLLESLKSLKVILLFTYSGLGGTNIEPLPNSVPLSSIDIAFKNKEHVRTILYWRPIVPGWNDDDSTIEHVLDVAQKTDAIAYTGLFYRPQQQSYFEEQGIELPYDITARRKVLPEEMELKILRKYKESGIRTPIFRKTSCAVAHAQGLPDYNGHYGVREICDICPASQVRICANAHRKPTENDFKDLLGLYEYESDFSIEDGHIWTSGLGEERRYHLQHTMGFQVWEREWPHLTRQHGRAPIGYSQSNKG